MGDRERFGRYPSPCLIYSAIQRAPSLVRRTSWLLDAASQVIFTRSASARRATLCPMPEHPLQAALDRSSRALRTATDLIEIAKGRKSPSGRSDARQASLYRAVVAASVGVVEEATEALIVEALRAQGIQPAAMVLLESAVARLMQNPNSSEVRKVTRAFLGFDPIPVWRLHLRTSAPAYRNGTTVGTKTSHQLWTIYNQKRRWAGSDAAQIWDRFVKVRHSFAHQDSSIVLFSKNEVETLRRLAVRKAATRDEIDFVERLTACAAVRVVSPAPQPEDPVRDWRLHETQAVNSLLAAAGIVASMADGLADHLSATGGIQRTRFDPLHLNIEKGDWVSLAGADLAASPCGVAWSLVRYKPGLRSA